MLQLSGLTCRTLPYRAQMFAKFFNQIMHTQYLQLCMPEHGHTSAPGRLLVMAYLEPPLNPMRYRI